MLKRAVLQPDAGKYLRGQEDSVSANAEVGMGLGSVIAEEDATMLEG